MSAPRIQKLKIASRKSDLAKLQSYLVAEALKSKFPDLETEFFFRESLGDKNQHDPLWKMPEKGVFTEDFVEGLKNGEFDVVVHSWKDLPTDPRPGLEIVGTLPRADVRDLILFPKANLEKVKASRQLKVLSSSPRREHNLRDFLKDALPFTLDQVHFHPVRGNIQTRVRKLFDGEGDALIVAKAAIDRLVGSEVAEFKETKDFLIEKLSQARWMVLPVSINPPAAAQGAIAIEISEARADLKELFSAISSKSDLEMVQKERQELRSYGGGCHQKIGIHFTKIRNQTAKFLQGQTLAGEILQTQEIVKTSIPKSSDTKPYVASFTWPVIESQLEKKVNLAKLFSEHQGFFVAKSTAIESESAQKALHNKQQTKPSVIWTAGLETWRKMARMGYWINGSTEGLGETLPNVETLFGEPLLWLKLTHDKGTPSMPILPTYKLLVNETELQTEAKKITASTHFFWRSGSQFEAVFSRFPEIKNKHHSCGPGHSFDLLSQQVRVEMFLDEKNWQAHFGFNQSKT